MDTEDTQLDTVTVYFGPTEVPFENIGNETCYHISTSHGGMIHSLSMLLLCDVLA
jgi:hypothetical protein